MPGTLFVVATPIGNLEDVTARAVRVLRESAVIAAEDTRRTAHLLARYNISTPTTSLHEHNEDQKARVLINRLRAGDDVALVSDAGTPTISDPGQRLIQRAIEAGIRVDAVPGPSAVLAALAVSGLPTDTFTFLGFPPTRSRDRSRWFGQLRNAGRTVVFFEAPHRIQSTLQQIRAVVGDCRVSVGRELTKTHEELVRGPISKVISALNAPRGEFTVVADIGHITELAHANVPDAAAIAAELSEMTASAALSRRRGIATLARKYGLSSNQVYDLVESAKKSGERPNR